MAPGIGRWGHGANHRFPLLAWRLVPRGVRLLHLWVVVSGLSLVSMVGACSNMPVPAGVQTDQAPHPLTLRAPAEIEAGEPIQVDVTSDRADSVFLLATGTFGSVPFTATLTGGAATLILDPIYSRHAGMVTFLARSGQAQAQTTTNIRPGQPVDPLLPLVGPRSIVADGKHWTMVVAVPADAYGNPLADGYPVAIRAQHPLLENGDPQSAVETRTTEIERLFAWARIYSRTRAGRTFLAVGAGNAHSPEQDVMEVPGLPVSFHLHTEQPIGVADGRQMTLISSDQLHDHFGNLLSDGTSVQLLVKASDGSRRVIPSITQNGRIYARLQSPNTPGVLTVYGQVAGIRSEPLVLHYTVGPAIRDFPVQIKLTEQRLLLVAGPLLGPIDQLIPDGTPVHFTITGPDRTTVEISAQSESGYARLSFRLDGWKPGKYQVLATVGSGQGWDEFVVR